MGFGGRKNTEGPFFNVLCCENSFAMHTISNGNLDHEHHFFFLFKKVARKKPRGCFRLRNFFLRRLLGSNGHEFQKKSARSNKMSQTVDFLIDFRNFVQPLAETVHKLRQNVDRDPEDTCGLKNNIL